jgi:CubicO group peptidase (beta-lactamase class C family)
VVPAVSVGRVCAEATNTRELWSKLPLRTLSITIAVLLGSIVSAQRVEAQDLVFSRFESYLESFRVQAGIPAISAIVARNGVVLWERGFGRRDVEAGAPATPDTPYPIGGLSQTFGATLLLRKCVDQWGAQLDDPVALRNASFAEPQTTLRQLLSHTTADATMYQYAPERFAALAAVIERCAQRPYRAVLASEILDRFAMLDSSPDQALAVLTAEDAQLFDAARRAHFAEVIGRIATPYRVTSGRPQRNADLVPQRLDAADGVISSVRDLIRFDNALGSNALLAPATRSAAWTQAFAGATPLPTGLGWFVQSYHGEPIVWQFGLIRGGYSSLLVKAPNLGLTFIALANSDGLSAPYQLEAGDVTSSIFATLFLRLFVP